MSGFQTERLEADRVEIIVLRHLTACCDELAKHGAVPANTVALMMKECADGLGEIDEALTRRFLRTLLDAYTAKIAGDRRANARAMTKLALCVQELALLEMQKFAKPEVVT